MSTAEFRALKEVCRELYPRESAHFATDFALYSALRSLGIPCELSGQDVGTLSIADAADALDLAFRQRVSRRTHLCPLDLAGQIPDLRFGANEVRVFSKTELNSLVDVNRHLRFSTQCRFDSERLSQFTWLVVKEEYEVAASAGSRNMHHMDDFLDRDYGQIEPHGRTFPESVDAALFALCLMPWETWIQYKDMNWRAFRVPWHHTIDEDIFVRPSAYPSADSLNWETRGATDQYGEAVEYEAPLEYPLDDNVAEAANWLTDDTWSSLQSARKSPLFGAPISHFLVRAFLSDGIDEFLAHIITIEATLGEEADRRKSGGLTGRVAQRLAAILKRPEASDEFRRLHDLRNKFVHGREMTVISSADRNLARSLARSAVVELIRVCLREPATTLRGDYLAQLCSSLTP